MSHKWSSVIAVFLRFSELELIYHLAERFPLFSSLHANLSSLRILVYGLAVALNFNVLLAPPSLSSPFSILYAHYRGTHRLSRPELLR